MHSEFKVNTIIESLTPNLRYVYRDFQPHITSIRTPILIQIVNSLKPGNNGHHFSDHIFKCIYLAKNVSIFTEISLTFVPDGPINSLGPSDAYLCR